MAERKNEAKWLDKYHRWQINVQKDGKRKTFYSRQPGTKGKINAEKQADKWLATDQSDSNIRFSKLWEQFLAYKKLHQGKSSSDITNLESIGRLYLVPKLGNKKISAIKRSDWQNCIDAIFAYSKNRVSPTGAPLKPFSEKYLKDIRGAMTAVCTYARKHGRAVAVAEDVEIPAGAPTGKRKILSAAEIAKLLAPPEDYKYFWWLNFARLLIVTGLRPGEAIGIKPASNIKNGILTIDHSINTKNEITDGKNSNARRIMELPPIALDIINQQQTLLRQQGLITPWLFPSKDGQHASEKAIYAAWKRFCRKQGITPTSLYELRHTMISAAKKDVPLQLLKQLVGHSATMDTIGVYGHIFDGDLEAAADATQEVFGGIITKYSTEQ